MKPFCEVVVSSILPAMRSLLTKELLTTYHLTQKQTADLLGLTQPAISQYIIETRASKIKLLEKQPEIMKMIEDLAYSIVNKNIKHKEIQLRFCEICKSIRQSRIICRLHEEMYPQIAPCIKCPEEC
jgi:hypothetical protein